MMIKIIVVIATLFYLLQVSVVDSAPHTPVWPLQWNSTWVYLYTNNGSFIDYGYWFYDAVNNLLRQDNHAHCNDIEVGVLCSAVFKNNNIYWYIPSKNICCLCWPNVPITGPNWLNISIYEGNTMYEWLDIPVSQWNFTADGDHIYYQSLSSTLPVAESGWGTDMYWVDIVLGHQNPDVFYTPGSCSTPCNTTLFHCSEMASAVPKYFFDMLRYIRE